MVSRVGPDSADIVIRFGGGIHSRASVDEINVREATGGQNFILDAQNLNLRSRPPFDKIGQPQQARVNGFITGIFTDGTVQWLAQVGDGLYQWDGNTFTNVATVNNSSRLRGPLEANWLLDDEIIVTDLALQSQVHKWNGTALSSVVFLASDGSTPFGTFRAKYCQVANERAIFANVVSSTATPNLIVGSKRSDYTQLSVSNRPSSSLSAEDPWFLPTPDNRGVNGVAQAFGVTAFSTELGNMFQLIGDDATDFLVEELYPRSGASGNESMAFVGNDILYGRQGRLESLQSSDKYGDVETDDLTRDISNLIAGFNSWRLTYNGRTQMVYCEPIGGSQIWIYNKAVAAAQTTGHMATRASGGETTSISPWSKWTSNLPGGLNPTAIMNMISPVDGLEYVFWGDQYGNIYQMEGSGLGGDGGVNTIPMDRTSKLFSIPLNAEAYDVEGWIKYIRSGAGTVTLTFLYQGQNLFTTELNIVVPATAEGFVWSGADDYWGGTAYYGNQFVGKMIRQNFKPIGQGTDFQVKITYDSNSTIEINEIGLRFTAATP